MESVRTRYQGISNIVRFNWHYYALAALLEACIILLWYYNLMAGLYVSILLLIIALPPLISLAVSYYIYDHSSLYTLGWLKSVPIAGKEKLLNINAGFDETTPLLKQAFPDADLLTADFFEPEKHTEISIRRARKAYPSLPGTVIINTHSIEMHSSSIDAIFIFFAAHEIRNPQERTRFFGELKRILRPEGIIVVTEHLRDAANLFAYNLGVMHFYTSQTWHRAFAESGLTVVDEIKVTPFITSFILIKNGTAS